MKRLISIIICLLFSVMVFAQEGVKFRDLTFEEALAVAKAEKKMLFVDCYAYWCGPCKRLAPILDELAKEYAGEIYIYKVDTEKERELAAVFGIRSIPTLLFCPKGENPQIAQGALPKEQLKEAIDKVLLKK